MKETPRTHAFVLHLLRHGNTFAPGESVVWLGNQDDPPLAEYGIEQMCLASRYFQTSGAPPVTIYAAPALRMMQSAEIVRNHCPTVRSIVADPRLSELDYGDWNGLTNAEIEQRYGRDPMNAWLDRGVWPAGYRWSPGAERAEEDARRFIEQLTVEHPNRGSVVVISTNGRLRYFLKLIPGTFEEYAARSAVAVRTGNLGLIRNSADRWELVYWNRNPADCF